ncbi:EF-hand domain-containing protein [Qipengyuania aquimaris]|uniref:EF-hand domain-containing protein n=1 Tax=Qipengyuania aquimaris TaxID=255984 RepID=UPI001FCFD3FF|nr:EF-hand domain-containing protein [Qipengyuania aquimaris]UOR14824.1 EF-hand domain-containing protein [Qipengyuania aquimaris]
MSRIVLGCILTLIAAGIGLFWWQGPAEVEAAAPPPSLISLAGEAPDPESLPTVDPGDLEGPAPPEASELTKEQRRFFRYDRNRDWRITRSEMLSTRSDAFRKLDKDGNNLLTFEEWAVTTVEKFEGADANGDRELSPGEFATTKPKPTRTRRCNC